MDKFLKLSTTTNFTIKAVGNFQWKRWDSGAKKMVTSDTYSEGFKKQYPINTAGGVLELTPNQIGSLLAEVLNKKEQGKADLIGAIFDVVTKPALDSNGNQRTFNGKLVNNYFFNFKGYAEEVFEQSEEFPDEPPF